MREKSAFLNFSVLICVFIFYTETQADNNFDLECALVPHNKFVRNPNSCKDYFKCSDGRIALKGSCPEQLLFNDLTQGCDFPNKVNCQSCNTDFGLQHFVDSRNCSNFYKCVHNVKKHFRCPDNMYFDFGSSSCLDKEFVDCEFTPMTEFAAVSPPNNDPWAIPGIPANRPPPDWGPPRPPPGSGFGGGGWLPPLPPGGFPPIAPQPPTRPPGGIGVWRPPNGPVRPPRPPWGPPDAPVGGGGWKQENDDDLS